MTDYMMSESALEEWAQKVLLEGANPRLKAMESRIDRIVQHMAEYAGAAAEMRLELKALKDQLDAMENDGLKAVHSVNDDPAQTELFTESNMGCWAGHCEVCNEWIHLTPRHKARLGMICEECVKKKEGTSGEPIEDWCEKCGDLLNGQGVFHEKWGGICKACFANLEKGEP